MNMLGKFWMGACKFVYSLGGDKWCHVFFGTIIAFLVATISHNITGEAPISGAFLGVLVTVAVGFIKEVIDSLVYGDADWRDIVATVAGGVIGFDMFLL